MPLMVHVKVHVPLMALCDLNNHQNTKKTLSLIIKHCQIELTPNNKL